VSATERKDELN